MKVAQKQYIQNSWVDKTSALDGDATLVLAFGDGALLSDRLRWQEIRDFYPSAHIVSASSSGEILDTQVFDQTIVLTAISFEHASVMPLAATVATVDRTYEAAKQLAGQLPHEGLVHVLTFSDGLFVNGSDLARGIVEALPQGVTVTGGMAGDADRFEKTYCGLDQPPAQNQIVLVGLYGPLQVNHGSFGGWDPFGVPRVVTKSSGSTVYELDHEPILDLYKKYLGELASQLPSSGLLFPLNIKAPDSETHLVRTLLSIDEQDKSITYAGDVPRGSMAQLMKANFNRLIEGAEQAAKNAHVNFTTEPDFALLISCVGRKLVLKDRIEEETEAVKNIMGDQVSITGFYSYGEIAPALSDSFTCELHNQTMTITTISESHE